MPVSPHDFSLWARATGNNYPNSVEEKARLAPEVHNFARNYAKPGAIGAQDPEEEGEIEQKQSNLGSNLAKAALVAGGVAATIAAARDPRVQRGFQVAKESVVNTSDRVKDFLQTVGQPSTVDMDVVNASGDVTPNPRQQQAAAGPEITTTGVTSPVAREVPGFDQDGEYIHPSRIPGMEGGDYRGRNLDTEAPSTTLRQGRKDNEAGLFNRYQETGEIPASQLSPEQKAALRIPEEDVSNIINEAKARRAEVSPKLLAPAREEVSPKLLAPAREEASPKSIYVTETDEKDIGPQHFMPGTNMSWDDVHFNAGIGKYADPGNDLASARAAVNNELIAAGMLKEGGTLQPGQSLTPEQKAVLNPDTLTNLKAAHQASQNLAQVEASGEPGVLARVENFIPEVGVIHSLPEAVENDRTNSLLASSITPDNQVPKVDKDLSGTSLTSQHDIEMEADNAIDIAKARLGRGPGSTGQPTDIGTDVDNFLKVQSAQRQNAAISDLDRQAYNIVAAGAEAGETISLERAQQILTDPTSELTFGEQRLFRGDDRVAIGQQTFVPGDRQSGRMMQIRSGASGRETSMTDADRYNLENVAGLTKQTRKGAGTSAMRGEEDRPNIAGVLPTGGGRNTRGMSAVGSNILDAAIGEQAAREELSDLTSNTVRREIEARNQPEQTYSKFTDYSTGQTPEGRARDARTSETAQSANRHQQMNQLFAAPTEGGLLQLRTSNRGNIKLSRQDLNATLGPIADNVWQRAAGHFAQEQGIQLPDPSSPDYFSAANNAIYGNSKTIGRNTKLVGRAFNKELQDMGIQLTEGGQDPYAAHTLYSIARKGASGELSLREFNTAARRAQSRGILDRNPNAPVPYGLTAPQQTGTSYQADIDPPRSEYTPKGRKISFNVPTREGINTPVQPTETSSGELSAEARERIVRQQEVFRKIKERMGLSDRDTLH